MTQTHHESSDTDAPTGPDSGPIPPSPERIMDLGYGFWGSKVLLSAVELGVFTELAREPLPLEALAGRVGLHPRSSRDFLDALVALGLLQRQDGRYSNAPDTDLFLDQAKPSYMGGVLDLATTRLYRFWDSLTEALRTGRPQSEIKHGGNFFATLYQQPERLKQFLHAMSGLSVGARWQWRRSSPGIATARSSTSAAPRAPCRCRWRLETSICPEAASTCPRSAPSSKSRCPQPGCRTSSSSIPVTSSPTRCRPRTCW